MHSTGPPNATAVETFVSTTLWLDIPKQTSEIKGRMSLIVGIRTSVFVTIIA